MSERRSDGVTNSGSDCFCRLLKKSDLRMVDVDRICGEERRHVWSAFAASRQRMSGAEPHLTAPLRDDCEDLVGQCNAVGRGQARDRCEDLEPAFLELFAERLEDCEAGRTSLASARDPTRETEARTTHRVASRRRCRTSRAPQRCQAGAPRGRPGRGRARSSAEGGGCPPACSAPWPRGPSPRRRELCRGGAGSSGHWRSFRRMRTSERD